MCMWASLGTISIGYTIVVGQTPTIWYTIRGSNLSLLLTMPIGGRMAGRCWIMYVHVGFFGVLLTEVENVQRALIAIGHAERVVLVIYIPLSALAMIYRMVRFWVYMALIYYIYTKSSCYIIIADRLTTYRYSSYIVHTLQSAISANK